MGCWMKYYKDDGYTWMDYFNIFAMIFVFTKVLESVLNVMAEIKTMHVRM